MHHSPRANVFVCPKFTNHPCGINVMISAKYSHGEGRGVDQSPSKRLLEESIKSLIDPCKADFLIL